MSKKRNIKRIKAQSYQFGGNAKFGFNDFMNLGIPALASISGENKFLDAVGSVGSGIQSGSKFGLPGMVAGGAATLPGIALNMRGNYKRKIEDDANSKQITNLQNRQSLDMLGNEMATDFDMQNPIIPTFQYGGVANNKAWVNNKETMVYPNGDFKNIYDNSGITDNVLENVPQGTVIFSDDLKIPGTKQTFSDRAKELNKIKDTNYKNQDKFANKSKELNEQYVNKEMSNLTLQQMLAQYTSGKSKASYKTGNVPSFRLGGMMFPNYAQNPNMLPEATVWGDPKPNNQTLPNSGTMFPNYAQKAHVLPEATVWGDPKPNNQTLSSGQQGLAFNGMSEPQPNNLGLDSSVRSFGNPPGGIQPNNLGLDSAWQFNTPTGQPNLNTNNQNNGNSNGGGAANMFGFGSDILTDYLSLAPYRYNVSEGNKAYDIVDPQHNPYEGQINRAMRARKISDAPMRDAIERQRRVSRYNTNNIRGTGAGMAYGLASDAMYARNEVDAINQTQHQNNQYVGEYANMMNNLGQQRASANVYAEDATARNKAARNQHKATASQQLGSWAQNKALMNNQNKNDDALLDILKPFLNEGFTKEQLEAIYKKLKK